MVHVVAVPLGHLSAKVQTGWQFMGSSSSTFDHTEEREITQTFNLNARDPNYIFQVVAMGDNYTFHGPIIWACRDLRHLATEDVYNIIIPHDGNKRVALAGDGQHLEGHAHDGNAERWKMYQLGNGKVALMNVGSRRFLTVGPVQKGHGNVVAAATMVQAWEELSLYRVPNRPGFVYFRSCHGTTITAPPNGQVYANGQHVAEWEMLKLKKV